MTLTMISEVLKCKNTHVLELVKYGTHMLIKYSFILEIIFSVVLSLSFYLAVLLHILFK